ncbi:MAG: hypothetical protein ACOH12_12560 [Parvibaculaceae bacterium]
MSDMSGVTTPSASLVTAYKYAANASASTETQQNQADQFGPAVIPPAPKLSGAALSAIKETAATAVPAVSPSLPAYDASGRSQDSNP